MGKWVVGGSHSVYTSTDNGHTWNTQDYMFDVKSARWCFAAFDSEKNDIAAHVEQIEYYNLTGQKLDTPSGLTIVVTYYSDGIVRTEKKMMR